MAPFLRGFMVGLVVHTVGQKLGLHVVTSIMMAIGISILIESVITQNEGDDDNA